MEILPNDIFLPRSSRNKRKEPFSVTQRTTAANQRTNICWRINNKLEADPACTADPERITQGNLYLFFIHVQCCWQAGWLVGYAEDTGSPAACKLCSAKVETELKQRRAFLCLPEAEWRKSWQQKELSPTQGTWRRDFALAVARWNGSCRSKGCRRSTALTEFRTWSLRNFFTRTSASDV